MEFLVIALLIGLLPAAIAQSKGRSFVLWWMYGAGLFIIALPHALMLKRQETAVVPRLVNAPSQETDRLLGLAEQAYLRKDYDGAIQALHQVLGLASFAPNTHFFLARLHALKGNAPAAYSSLSSAVEQGFSNWEWIENSPDLEFLRQHQDYRAYVANGYRKVGHAVANADMVGSLERLAKLRMDGILTEEEFQDAKRKFLGSTSPTLS